MQQTQTHIHILVCLSDKINGPQCDAMRFSTDKNVNPICCSFGNVVTEQFVCKLTMASTLFSVRYAWHVFVCHRFMWLLDRWAMCSATNRPKKNNNKRAQNGREQQHCKHTHTERNGQWIAINNSEQSHCKCHQFCYIAKLMRIYDNICAVCFKMYSKRDSCPVISLIASTFELTFTILLPLCMNILN